MKKFALGLAFFITLTATTFADSFSDVSSDHENYNAIEYLKENGVIDGYSDGTFGPDNTVNRAEAIKIISGAFGVATDGDYEILFPDVLSEEWFFPYVMGAQAAGIISGYSDGTFLPAETVNLAEELKMIVLAAGVELQEDVEDDVFVDVGSDEWYSPHAYYASKNNLVEGDGYGKVYPAQDMTRGAFSEVIYRMMKVLETGEAFPLDDDWVEFSSDMLPFKIKYNDDLWQVDDNDDEVVFFKPDLDYDQFSATRLYPNSAVVTITLDENDAGLAKADYFDQIEQVFDGGTYLEFTWKGYSALEVVYPLSRTVDWYIYLGNEVLVVYTEYGDGTMWRQLQETIEVMLSSMEYKEVSAVSYDEILSNILGNLLVEGVGMSLLDTLPDKMIIETDTIGVGTGPVDYYYSEGLDRTFKYERSLDVILDSSEGETSAF